MYLTTTRLAKRVYARMGTAPISPEDIACCLRESYGAELTDLTPLALGHANNTWVYRADTTQEPLFLKVKQTCPVAGLGVATWLAKRGVPVLAPLLTAAGRTSAACGEHHLMAYPFLSGDPVNFDAMSETDWHTLGTIVRAIHSAPLPGELKHGLHRESFLPEGERILRETEDKLIGDAPATKAVRALLTDHMLLLHHYLRHVEKLGAEALTEKPDFCLCHGDLQCGNILQIGIDSLVVIDWDDPVWAPAQTDTMFIPSHGIEAFQSAYGPFPDSIVVREYLSANWLLQEALDCIRRLLLTPIPDIQEHDWALDLLQRMLHRMRSKMPGSL